MRYGLVAGLVVISSLGAAGDLGAAPKVTRVVSKNFLLVGYASERDIRQVALRLEQFREVVSRVLPNASMASPQTTVVLVFDTDRSFRPYKPLYQGKPKDVTGYFQGGPDANYIALSLERGEASYPIIFHEYTHLMVRNVANAAPVWFGEGLAEYYSTFALSADRKKALIGKPIDRHVALLRGHFIPLKELLSVDRASPLYNDEQHRGLFYAESWAWVHFLLMGRQDRTRELVALLTAITAGTKVDDAFLTVFGTDPASFQSNLLNYVQQPSYQYVQYTLKEAVRDEKQTAAFPVSEAEWQAHLGDLLAHMGRLGDAEMRLESARALDPKLALTYASLGVVRMRQARREEAVELWRQATALESAGFGSDLARQWLDRVRPTRVAPQADRRGAGSDMPARPAQTGEGRPEMTIHHPPAPPLVIQWLRDVRPGEARAEGDLAQIDCRPEAVVFTVRAADREIRVEAKGFSDVDFVSFRDDKAGSIPCGPRKPGDRVYVTWRPLAPGEKPTVAGSVGRAVAVEFLPIKQQ